jgi:hypothetical protein
MKPKSLKSEQTVQTKQTYALPPQSATGASIGLCLTSASIFKNKFANRRVYSRTRTHAMIGNAVAKTNSQLVSRQIRLFVSI